MKQPNIDKCPVCNLEVTVLDALAGTCRNGIHDCCYPNWVFSKSAVVIRVRIQKEASETFNKAVEEPE